MCRIVGLSFCTFIDSHIASPPNTQESIKAARALAGRREGAADVWERAVLNLVAYGAVGRMDKAHVVRTTEVRR